MGSFQKYLAIVALWMLYTALIGAGFWFAGNKNGVSATLAAGNAKVAKVTQDALEEQNRLTARHNAEVARYVEQSRAEETRNEQLRKRLATLPKPCTDGHTGQLVRVLSDAINSPALPENPDQPFAIGDGDTVAQHHLYCIAEYERIATQLNALIETIDR